MFGSASVPRSERVHRCGTCRERVEDTHANDVLDCPRCGKVVHVGCAWDTPRCAGCGEGLQVEVSQRSRRHTPSRLRRWWEALATWYRDLSAQPLGLLAQCNSDRGRWMGISVSMFLLGVIIVVAIVAVRLQLGYRL
jgi:hypothetical protein